MRKSRTPGSVRGVSGNGYPYRDSIFMKTDQAQAVFTYKRIGMFVELVYDKRNVEGLEGAREIILADLTKRVHQIFPDAEVKVKPLRRTA